MNRLTRYALLLGCALALAVGCGDSGGDPPAPDAAPPAGDGPLKQDTGGKKDTKPSGKQGNGAPCAGPGQCKSDKCLNGKCVNGTATDGTPCTFQEQCANRKCESGKCGSGGTGKKPAGASCGKNGECVSGICYDGKCAKPCTKPSDCPGQICNSDDGKRVFCYTPKYNSKLGAFCGVDGACASGLTCVGNKYDHGAYCRGTCKTELDCPPSLECETAPSGGSTRYCKPRRFCSGCVHDGNCRDGMKCVAMTGGKYCASPCTPGSTECPMAAQCKAAGGLHVCQPKTGSCRGSGGVCSGCSKNDHCKPGGMCLSLSLSGESFCGAPCTSSTSCGGSYKCYNVGTTGQKQCGPGVLAGGKYPTCSSGVTFPIFNKGDRMGDFAMVGYRDTNNNGTLADETKLQVVKLSHFKTAKVILLNISAFW